MGLMILAIILFIAGVVTTLLFKKDARRMTNELEKLDKDSYSYRNDSKEYKEAIAKDAKYSTIIPIITTIIAVVLIIISTVAVVPTGYTGIKTTFGKVENDVLPSGINFIAPWQNVINMDNREQRSEFALEAFSKDIQQVDIQGSINFNIDKATAMNLYKDVGTEYKTILITPRVLEDVKVVIAKYTAENLIENRQKASDEIYALLKEELLAKGVNVISFAIENIDFTDAFESAVEAKQVATQEKQKAQTEQERQTMEMQQKAERDRIQAQAAADVQKIEAEAKAYAVSVQAEAEAKANKEIAATISEQLIKYNLIHQWDGKLPLVSSDGSNIIDLRNVTEIED